MAEYPFNIDVGTTEGQLEVLRLWSNAELDLSTAALILRETTGWALELASFHGIEPPTQEALDNRIRKLEARVRPKLRKTKRDHARERLTAIRVSISEALDVVASIALEAEAYRAMEAHRSYSVAHANLRRALDVLASAQEQYEAARRAESRSPADAEYTDVSLAVLRGLDRVVPRPDYYLIGDFNHVEPVTEHDILWSWSKGFLATATATKMLDLEEGDIIGEIADQLGIPRPREEALSPAAAAMILGDAPVDGDVTFNVRRRIRDGRLDSYFRSDVERRRDFERKTLGLPDG
jgi:hypothetical protein